MKVVVAVVVVGGVCVFGWACMCLCKGTLTQQLF